MCVQDEGRLTTKAGESVHLETQEKTNNQVKPKENGNMPVQNDIKKMSKCFFCKKKMTHEKRLSEFQIWFEKKCNSISCICYESTIIDVNYNT